MMPFDTGMSLLGMIPSIKRNERDIFSQNGPIDQI